MTLEISEIGVRLVVGPPPAPAAERTGSGSPNARLSPQQFEDLVKACVQEVLGALRMVEDR